MPNNLTISQAYANGGKSSLPSAAQGVSSTAEIGFADAVSSGNIFYLPIPGGDKIKNKPFKVKLWGRYASSGTPNLTVALYWVTNQSTLFGSGTAVATTGAVATVASGEWYLEFQGIWGGTSTKFSGVMSGWVAATAVARAVNSSQAVPALATSTENSAFTATLTFSGSSASNNAILDGFEMEVL